VIAKKVPQGLNYPVYLVQGGGTLHVIWARFAFPDQAEDFAMWLSKTGWGDQAFTEYRDKGRKVRKIYMNGIEKGSL
jgi:hypothetical protein